MAKKTKFKATAQARTATPKELQSDIRPAAPPLLEVRASGAVRRPGATNFQITYSPGKVVQVLQSVRAGADLTEYYEMGMAVLRRSPKLRSVMQTRVLAVTGLPSLVKSAGTSRQDKKALAACQSLTETPHFKKLLRHLAWAPYIGWQGAQTIYGEGTEYWPITDFKRNPASWFVFDTTDEEVPLMLPAVVGEKPGPLEPPGKFVFHAPSLLPGAPFRNGLMFTAIFFACLTDVVLSQGSTFVELFGMPMRLGKFPLGTGPEHQKNMAVMQEALETLGSDSWAMIPTTMQIEFLKDATVSGSIETYERWARYFDELLSQLILGGSLTGGTSNTGSGGAQALGNVHNELRSDIMRADASDIAETVVRDAFTPFVEINFAGAVVPSFSMPVPEVKQVQEKSAAMQGFMDRGVKFLVEDVHELLQTTVPQEGDETVGGRAPAEPEPDDIEADAPAAKAQNALRARFAATSGKSGQGTDGEGAARDELDVLIDKLLEDDGYVAADEAVDAQLMSAVEAAAAEGPDAIKAALLALIESADVDAMRAAFTAGMTASRAAGEQGVELTDVGAEA